MKQVSLNIYFVGKEKPLTFSGKEAMTVFDKLKTAGPQSQIIHKRKTNPNISYHKNSTTVIPTDKIVYYTLNESVENK
ncbi:hypothetical protein [Thermoflavimicrobium daqui]|uniref:Uncharacterized protein n=1 Tax=Thermoflavimicrobium daqui TaxID=2137476 RepID=A0A364K2E9_9BACL|nr:hypothetical protein [Thermoflavimicrobium daqui]RAL22595.1 hypothetical protein DL897_14395 [Thermoflavimicrobium daqui]